MYTLKAGCKDRPTSLKGRMQGSSVQPHNTTQHNSAAHHSITQREYSPVPTHGLGAGCEAPHDRARALPERWFTNSVGCAHAPVPNTTLREPAAP